MTPRGGQVADVGQVEGRACPTRRDPGVPPGPPKVMRLNVAAGRRARAARPGWSRRSPLPVASRRRRPSPAARRVGARLDVHGNVAGRPWRRRPRCRRHRRRGRVSPVRAGRPGWRSTSRRRRWCRRCSAAALRSQGLARVGQAVAVAGDRRPRSARRSRGSGPPRPRRSGPGSGCRLVPVTVTSTSPAHGAGDVQHHLAVGVGVGEVAHRAVLVDRHAGAGHRRAAAGHGDRQGVGAEGHLGRVGPRRACAGTPVKISVAGSPMRLFQVGPDPDLFCTRCPSSCCRGSACRGSGPGPTRCSPLFSTPLLMPRNMQLL